MDQNEQQNQVESLNQIDQLDQNQQSNQVESIKIYILITMLISSQLNLVLIPRVMIIPRILKNRAILGKL